MAERLNDNTTADEEFGWTWTENDDSYLAPQDFTGAPGIKVNLNQPRKR